MLLSKLYNNLFHKKDIVPEVLIAYKYRIPDNIDVFIKQSKLHRLRYEVNAFLCKDFGIFST